MTLTGVITHHWIDIYKDKECGLDPIYSNYAMSDRVMIGKVLNDR